MEHPQNSLITLQSVSGHYSGKLVHFLAFQFLNSPHYIHKASNLSIPPTSHVPMPFLCDAKPVKSVCITVLVWIPEALNITPKALDFLPGSVITLQSISSYCSSQDMYLPPRHSGTAFSQWPVPVLVILFTATSQIDFTPMTYFTITVIAVTHVFIYRMLSFRNTDELCDIINIRYRTLLTAYA